MAKSRRWDFTGIVFVMFFQVVLQEKLIFDSLDWIQHGPQKEIISSTNQNVNDKNLEPKKQDITDYETSKSIISPNKVGLEHEFLNRNPRLTSLDLLSSQFEELCINIDSQPCTCSYPDNPDVTKFELITDVDIRLTASEANGTGPANCKDLLALGHRLNGFYMVRFNKKEAKAIYCEFQHGMKVNNIDRRKTIIDTSLKKEDNQGSLKNLRLCGDVTISVMGCTILYSDNPDTPKFENNREEPTNCEYLREIGYTMKGFYMVRLNAIKTKIVYCDFSLSSITTHAKEATSKTKSQLCSTIGSPPCSCNYPYTPKRLQFELSNDELTRSASRKNGVGPASCKDLELIGYNLNGFYIIKFTEEIMKTVFCEFGSNDEVPIITPARSETTIKKMSTPLIENKIADTEVLKLNRVSSNGKHENSKSSVQVSFKMKDNFFKTTVDSNAETPKSDKYTKPMDQTKKAAKNIVAEIFSPTTAKFRQEKFLNPSSGYVLMNDNGNCLAVETTGTINPDANGAKIIQANCDPSQKGQLWKYDKQTQMLCNGWGKCLSIPFNVRLDAVIPFDLIQWDPVDGQIRQKWSQLNNQFYSTGMCLAFPGYRNSPGAILGYCMKNDGSKEKRTTWTFLGN